MKKDFIRDYATEAFRLYARLGCPSNTEAQKLPCIKAEGISEVLNIATVQIPGAGMLLDIRAVNEVIQALKDSDDKHIIEAVRAVYFIAPSRDIRRREITERVKTFAISYPCAEHTVYNWLRRARRMFAKARNLRLE